MRRIIVIVVLSVLAVVLSGCNKIKTELERRHLGSASQKEITHSTPQTQTAIPVILDGVKEQSERKQIVLRIDLPADEKIQIRLIKNETPEEMSKNVAAVSPKETLEVETPPKAAEVPREKPDRPAESVEKKPAKELSDQNDEESKSEIKSDTQPESHSEMKTDGEVVFPPPPLLVPTAVVPAREMDPQPVLHDLQVKNKLASPSSSEPAPAEKAVGLALSVTSPETIASPSNKTQNAASATDKLIQSSPWAIPNAEYPLRYY